MTAEAVMDDILEALPLGSSSQSQSLYTRVLLLAYRCHITGAGTESPYKQGTASNDAWYRGKRMAREDLRFLNQDHQRKLARSECFPVTSMISQTSPAGIEMQLTVITESFDVERAIHAMVKEGECFAHVGQKVERKSRPAESKPSPPSAPSTLIELEEEVAPDDDDEAVEGLAQNRGRTDELTNYQFFKDTPNNMHMYPPVLSQPPSFMRRLVPEPFRVGVNVPVPDPDEIDSIDEF